MTISPTRRSVLKSGALAMGALAAPFVRGAYAAGKLRCGFWDHWVPGANEPLAKLCNEWAEREKVDLSAPLKHTPRPCSIADQPLRKKVAEGFA